ncbi:MAG: xanthine dehydrogenase accessory protein XdhC [Pseudomonadota bacterium]
MIPLSRELNDAIARDGPKVLVTVARVKGSSPRAAGTKMVVWQDGFSGTIGGGNLEHVTLDKARALLSAGPGTRAVLSEIPLGPSLGQCCGGSVLLLFEPLGPGAPPWAADLAEASESEGCHLLATRVGPDGSDKQVVSDGGLAQVGFEGPALRAAGRLLEGDGCRVVKAGKEETLVLESLADRRPAVLLFGAGHTGRALAPLLGSLPFRVFWIDERPSEFPDELPKDVRIRAVAEPQGEVDQAPSGALYLVMTHSHQRDFELCARVLSRGDFAYLGLIGSATKRARFEHRFREGGLDEATIARMTCPIGIAGITGKDPAEIAVAVAAQLLQIGQEATP